MPYVKPQQIETMAHFPHYLGALRIEDAIGYNLKFKLRTNIPAWGYIIPEITFFVF